MPETFRISCNAAPLWEVTTATFFGESGRGRFLPGSKRPSAASFRFSSSSCTNRSPSPAGRIPVTYSWYFPCCGKTSTYPSARTESPSLGRIFAFSVFCRNITQLTAASGSFREKYQWPEAM